MISLPSEVRNVLRTRASVPIKNGRFLLQEPKVMAVEVVAVHKDVIVINLDKLGSLGGIKDQYQSRCDYLVLCQASRNAKAVFVELKKTLSQKKKGLEQLRSASPYLSFLTELSRVVGPADEQVPRISVRHVLIGSRVAPMLDKRRLSDSQVLPDKTHRGITVRRLVGERLRFSKLVGPF